MQQRNSTLQQRRELLTSTFGSLASLLRRLLYRPPSIMPDVSCPSGPVSLLPSFARIVDSRHVPWQLGMMTQVALGRVPFAEERRGIVIPDEGRFTARMKVVLPEKDGWPYGEFFLNVNPAASSFGHQKNLMSIGSLYWIGFHASGAT